MMVGVPGQAQRRYGSVATNADPVETASNEAEANTPTPQTG